MHHLKDKEGKCVYDSKGIIQEFANFYNDLYTSKKPLLTQIKDYLKKLSINDLLLEHKQWIEQPKTEIIHTIKNLKVNKAPGPDGYNVEFYKHFATW